MKKNIAKNAVLLLNNKIKLLALFCIIFTNAGAQNNTITGKVTDTLGMPLPAVSVTIQGSSSGTNTDWMVIIVFKLPQHKLYYFLTLG